ncbi:MAG: flagellar motor switch protein FliN [Deltaproteobacteria bacterium RIFOXYD12_FULL_56_24]|nr:MAG: flagellar motor switch protein FliN [Deltaproteobacteria bacterium RIFOXYD12_FULL_56_24]
MADDPLNATGTKAETDGAGDDWAAALNEQEGSERAQAPAFAELGTTATTAPAGSQNLDFLLDIPLEVTVELGRTSMIINKMLQLTQGSVVELDKAAGESVEIFVNDKLLGKGEVIVINERFGVRITEIISQADRVKNIA